ncbi:hypothetical protein KW803_03420 [Candidatus Saccharibacteria bacterium]|nr:hypothetical protein [Candidatus Saccharibacteria bacterium]
MAKEVKKPSSSKAAAAGGRTRKLTKKQAKGKVKQEVKTRKSLSGSFKLTASVLMTIKLYWKPLGGIVLVYLLLNIVFASGISNVSTAFSNIKDNIDATGNTGLLHAAAGFASLIGSAGSSGSSTGSTLQSILFVIESLVIIWALRHLLSGQNISVKLAYYRAMTPLIPFLLVIFVIIIQLLPVTIGATVFAAISTSVFAGSSVASVVSVVAFILLAAWSIYMVSASIFALYIVTLPDIQPRQALRSAKDLVRFRRAVIIRKVFFLPLFILVLMGVIMVPLILYVPAIVPAVFYALSMLAILFMHTYLYSLYREMIA